MATFQSIPVETHHLMYTFLDTKAKLRLLTASSAASGLVYPITVFWSGNFLLYWGIVKASNVSCTGSL